MSVNVVCVGESCAAMFLSFRRILIEGALQCRVATLAGHFVTTKSPKRGQLGLQQLGHFGSHSDADIVTVSVIIPVVANFFGWTMVVELEGHLIRTIRLVGIYDGDISNEL